MKKYKPTGNVHERALSLIVQDRIEGIDADEERWLSTHLAECDACATQSASTAAVLQTLRTNPIPLPGGLAALTKLRVREEAANIKRRRTRNLALIAGCAVSWMAGVASAPLVWKVCEWVGTTLDLPKVVWELGFLSWWLVPAASVGLVVLWMRARAEREEFNR